MPRNFSELKSGGGQFLCCPPTLKSGGTRPPVPQRSTPVPATRCLSVFTLVRVYALVIGEVNCLFDSAKDDQSGVFLHGTND